MEIYTIGHGTMDAATFCARLREAGIARAVDVRRFAGSRRNPQFGVDALSASLRAADIDYRPMPELGGRRHPRPDSRHCALRNAGFRGYADFMEMPAFFSALDELLAGAADRATVIFCAETLWWRCHRRLVADAVVLLRGGRVRHLVGARTSEHVPTPGVRVDGGMLVYDVPEPNSVTILV